MPNNPRITQESPKNHPDFSATDLGVGGTLFRGWRGSFLGLEAFVFGGGGALSWGFWGFILGLVGFVQGDDGSLSWRGWGIV